MEMSRLNVLLLILAIYVNTNLSVELKNEENKSLADILKLVNQHPGLEIRVEFDDDEVNPPKISQPESPAESETSTISLAKELNQTSTNILEKLNKTALKLDEVLKRLNKIEKLFQEKPKEVKEVKEPKTVRHLQFKVSNQTEDISREEDQIADLLLT